MQSWSGNPCPKTVAAVSVSPKGFTSGPCQARMNTM